MTLLTNFSANEGFFAVFWTRLTNMDSANECLLDARANIKQQTWMVGPSQELIISVCMCVTKKWADHITQGRHTNPTGFFTFETARSEMPDNISWNEQTLCLGWKQVSESLLKHSEKKRSSINFGQIFYFSFSKETEASYWRRGDLPWINFENLEEE